METRRLQMLAELARLGSMRAVAEVTGATTSTVSQQIAALAQDMGTVLIEPDGRRVRLTPAGRRLAEHAVTILAAVEAARRDLSPDAQPSGTVRLAGSASTIRAQLLPIISTLSASYPRLHVLVREQEPPEALRLLAADEIDLAFVYDYNLAPFEPDPATVVTPLWTAPWGSASPTRPSLTRLSPPMPSPTRPSPPTPSPTPPPTPRRRPPLPDGRLDRQLARQRRRDRAAHPGVHGRFRAPLHAPGGQPRPRPGHDRGGPGVGCCPWACPRGPASACCPSPRPTWYSAPTRSPAVATTTGRRSGSSPTWSSARRRPHPAHRPPRPSRSLRPASPKGGLPVPSPVREHVLPGPAASEGPVDPGGTTAEGDAVVTSRASGSGPLIVVAAAVVWRARLLVVSKKAAPDVFYLPGGKPDGAEEPLEALARELDEELGVRPVEPRPFAEVEAVAALEGVPMRLTVFEAALDRPQRRGRVGGAAVDHRGERDIRLAPALSDHVLPLLRQRGALES
ncbi:LysR family transcriptional regulator [Streptomyces sp. M19]